MVQSFLHVDMQGALLLRVEPPFVADEPGIGGLGEVLKENGRLFVNCCIAFAGADADCARVQMGMNSWMR